MDNENAARSPPSFSRRPVVDPSRQALRWCAGRAKDRVLVHKELQCRRAQGVCQRGCCQLHLERCQRRQAHTNKLGSPTVNSGRLCWGLGVNACKSPQVGTLVRCYCAPMLTVKHACNSLRPGAAEARGPGGMSLCKSHPSHFPRNPSHSQLGKPEPSWRPCKESSGD
jgi:hypothetical protein